MKSPYCACLAVLVALATSSIGGVPTSLLRETGEAIAKNLGLSGAKQVDEVVLAVEKAIVKHGDDALPVIRAAGPAGMEALETAGKKAPEIIKLYAKRGDTCLWVISEPKKLAIFLKHGDSAAEALLKHQGIADNLLGQVGAKVLPSMEKLTHEGGQMLGMAAKHGVFEKTSRSGELLDVVAKFGDKAMAFIWRNKGPLAVTATLTAFLNNPEPFIDGTQNLITGAVVPIGKEIAQRTNWTPVMITALIVFAGLISLRQFFRNRREAKGA